MKDSKNVIVGLDIGTSKIVASNGDQIIDAEPFQVFQHFFRKVVALRRIFVPQVVGDAIFWNRARPGTRSVEEGASRPGSFVHQGFS